MKMFTHHTGNLRTGQRGGTWIKLLVFLFVFSCVVAAAWIYFLPALLTSTLQKQTGFRVKVTQLAFNPFTARVDLKGLVISNPPGFPRPHFMEVTSFEANAQMKTLFSDNPVFDYARIEVAYVALVRDANGVLNAQLFNDRLNSEAREAREAAERKPLFGKKDDPEARDVSATQGGPANPKADAAKNTPAGSAKSKTAATETAAKDKKAKDAAESPAKPAAKPIRFTINRLELALNKIIVADYTSQTPDIREYNCKLYYTFKDFKDPKQLLAPFAMKSLQTVGAAIQALIPGGIGKTFGAATQPAEPMLPPKPTDEKETAKDPIKTVVEKLEESQKP